MRLWPQERAVWTRDVEQRLLQLNALISRAENNIPSFPIGRGPVNPDVVVASDPCDGENPTTFFDTTRVFSFTLAGLSSCTQFNRAWSLTWDGTHWTEIHSSGGTDYTAKIFHPALTGGTNVNLVFTRSTPGNVGTTYRINKCLTVIPGVNSFGSPSIGSCSGWPGSISVTIT